MAQNSEQGVPESLSGLSLVVEPPTGESMIVPVTGTSFLIGRHKECDLTLRDNRISRRHARIVIEHGHYLIDDLESKHGLSINGEHVQRKKLLVGDRISFGIEDSYVLTVGEGQSPSVPLLKQLKRVAGLSDHNNRTGALSSLAAMLEVSRSLESSGGFEEVFEAVVEAALAVTQADRAFLLLKESSDDLIVRVARNINGQLEGSEAQAVPRKMIAEALDGRRGLFSMNIDPASSEGSVEGTDPGKTTSDFNLQSVACVPIVRMQLGLEQETSMLSASRDTLGALYMDTLNPNVNLMDGANQTLLQALALETSMILENARLLEEQRGKQFMEQELKIAHDIQQSLLPRSLPMEGWLTAKGQSKACFQLGGDYYDVMQLAPGSWGAVVADVSGKGVAASLLVSLLQGAFFLGSDPNISLASMLQRVNCYICERSQVTRFATVFALILEENGSMRWSSTGHCPAILVRRDGSLEWLKPNSQPIGLFMEAQFTEEISFLEPGDKLLVYSDGVSEARNTVREVLGEQRLGNIVEDYASAPTSEFFDGVLGKVLEFVGDASLEDDFTLLALGYGSI